MKVPDFIDLLLYVSRVLYGIRVLLNPVFPAFSPLERQLLSEIEHQVSGQFRTIFQAQIKAINFVQRDGGHRRVRLYKWRCPGWYSWEREHYFEPIKGEIKLVHFSMLFRNENVVNGTLASIDGVFCNILFGSDVNHLRERTDFTVSVRKTRSQNDAQSLA